MSSITTLFDWCLVQFSAIWSTMATGMSWLGVCLIGMMLLRRIIKIIRKVY